MARVYVAEKYIDGRTEGEVNLALTGLTSSKHTVKRVIQHRRRSEVSCL